MAGKVYGTPQRGAHASSDTRRRVDPKLRWALLLLGVAAVIVAVVLAYAAVQVL